MPIVFNNNTTLPRLVLWISGIGESSNSLLYDHAVYNLKHFPGAIRPALPALWLALAFEQGTTYNDSIPVEGLKDVYLTNPQSTTYMILSIVILVSAILVANTTFLHPFGVGSNILIYYSLGKAA